MSYYNNQPYYGGQPQYPGQNVCKASFIRMYSPSDSSEPAWLWTTSSGRIRDAECWPICTGFFRDLHALWRLIVFKPPPSGPPGGPAQGSYPPPPGPPPIPGNYPGSSYGSGPPQANNSYYPPPGPPPGHSSAPQGSPYPPPPGPPPGPHGSSYPPPGPPPHGGPSPYYGAPSAPPPVQYNSAPGYGQPAPFFLGVQVPVSTFNRLSTDPPVPGYDARGDVEAIHKATKGFGTNESQCSLLTSVFFREADFSVTVYPVIKTLAPLNAIQAHTLSVQYKAAKGRDLGDLIAKETSSWFAMGLRGIILGPVTWDVELVHRAVSGLGTHEDLLNEILLSRTNDEINILKAAYQDRYGRRLEQMIMDDLSMKTKNMFVMVLNASRVPDNAPVRQPDVDADVERLYNAGVGRRGTDEV
ncbi:hypothetical protein HGRIS_012732 [Hohenbuehelia grisea]|uniref:Annexin n=1 Tax=Hohenbuehelia grisea TaxID=104357 RepID=A0ABR3IT61_9AGAR